MSSHSDLDGMGLIPASPDARNVPLLLCQERFHEASLYDSSFLQFFKSFKASSVDRFLCSITWSKVRWLEVMNLMIELYYFLSDYNIVLFKFILINFLIVIFCLGSSCYATAAMASDGVIFAFLTILHMTLRSLPTLCIPDY